MPDGRVGLEDDRLLHTLDGAEQKHFRSFQYDLRAVLQMFEDCGDWTDLPRILASMMRCFASHRDCSSVPEKIWLCKRLGQCLRPALPSGVHSRVVHVYRELLTGRQLSGDLAMFSCALFSLLPHAQQRDLRFMLLGLLESKLVEALPVADLTQCLDGLLGCVLPTLEDDSAADRDARDAIVKLLRDVEGRFEAEGRFREFCYHMWNTVRLCPKSRLGGLLYLRELGRRPLPKSSRRQEQSQLTEDSLGGDSELVVDALCTCLSAYRQDQQLRAGLEMLNACFMIHESGALPPEGVTRIMKVVLGLYARDDLMLTRRIERWFDGDDRQNPQYFVEHTRGHVCSALRSLLDEAREQCCAADGETHLAATALQLLKLLGNRDGVHSAVMHPLARLQASLAPGQLLTRAVSRVAPNLAVQFCSRRLLHAAHPDALIADGADYAVEADPDDPASGTPLQELSVATQAYERLLQHGLAKPSDPGVTVGLMWACLQLLQSVLRSQPAQAVQCYNKGVALLITCTAECREGVDAAVFAPWIRALFSFIGQLVDERWCAGGRRSATGDDPDDAGEGELADSTARLIMRSLSAAADLGIRDAADGQWLRSILDLCCSGECSPQESVGNSIWLRLCQLALELLTAADPPLPPAALDVLRGQTGKLLECMWRSLDVDSATRFVVCESLVRAYSSCSGVGDALSQVILAGLRPAKRGDDPFQILPSGFRRFCVMWRVTEEIPADPGLLQPAMEQVLRTLRSETPQQRAHGLLFLRQASLSVPRCINPLVDRLEGDGLHGAADTLLLLCAIAEGCPAEFIRAVAEDVQRSDGPCLAVMLQRCLKLIGAFAERGQAADEADEFVQCTVSLRAAQLTCTLLRRGRMVAEASEEFKAACAAVAGGVQGLLQRSAEGEDQHITLELGRVLLLALRGARTATGFAGDLPTKRGRAGTAPPGRSMAMTARPRAGSHAPLLNVVEMMGPVFAAFLSASKLTDPTLFAGWCELMRDLHQLFKEVGRASVHMAELFAKTRVIMGNVLGSGCAVAEAHRELTLSSLRVACEAVSLLTDFVVGFYSEEVDDSPPEKRWSLFRKAAGGPSAAVCEDEAAVVGVLRWVTRAVLVLDAARNPCVATAEGTAAELRGRITTLVTELCKRGSVAFTAGCITLWSEAYRSLKDHSQLQFPASDQHVAVLKVTREVASYKSTAELIGCVARVCSRTNRPGFDGFAMSMLEGVLRERSRDAGHQSSAVTAAVVHWFSDFQPQGHAAAASAFRLILEAIRSDGPISDRRVTAGVSEHAAKLVEGVCRALANWRAEAVPALVMITDALSSDAPDERRRRSVKEVIEVLFPMDTQVSFLHSLHAPAMLSLPDDDDGRHQPRVHHSLRFFTRLVELLEHGTKALRDPLVAHVTTSHSFFSVDSATLALWTRLCAMLVSEDDLHANTLIQTITRSKDSSMFTSARTQERARIRSLRRLAFAVRCVPHLSNAKVMSDIQQKLKLSSSCRPQEVLPHAFLVYRAVLTKVDPRHLEGYWMPLVTELVKVFGTSLRDHGDLLFSAVKAIDLLDVVAQQYFHAYRWVFVGPPMGGEAARHRPLLGDEIITDETLRAALGRLREVSVGKEGKGRPLVAVPEHRARRVDVKEMIGVLVRAMQKPVVPRHSSVVDIRFCTQLLEADLAERVDDSKLYDVREVMRGAMLTDPSRPHSRSSRHSNGPRRDQSPQVSQSPSVDEGARSGSRSPQTEASGSPTHSSSAHQRRPHATPDRWRPST
eukprot:TRINITY_DN8232_c0_g2_i1.p1 TRINITY_DN8232_c0_g2~~TRINITY_DN8232_c0_g2_i1.p1  ORF type:complete len:1755 (+),score=646.51 TRINITY_DN8232_c0_g2_i1:165-5429(+)